MFFVLFFSMPNRPVWKDCAKAHIKKIQVFQNKALKMSLNLEHRYPTISVHQEANAKTVQQLIDETTLKFFDRCQLAPNPLINNLPYD